MSKVQHRKSRRTKTTALSPTARYVPSAQARAAGRSLDRVAAAAQIAFQAALLAYPGRWRRIPKEESRAAGRSLDRWAAAARIAYAEYLKLQPANDNADGSRKKVA